MSVFQHGKGSCSRADVKRSDSELKGNIDQVCVCDVAGARDHPDVVESFMKLHAQVEMFYSLLYITFRG